MPSEAAARELAERWIEAWNRHDLDAILEHYTDDVEFVSPFAANFTADRSGVIRGREALRSYFVRALGAYPNLRFELHQALAGVRTVAIVYRSVNELHAVEVMELDEAGRARSVAVHYAAPSTSR